MSLRTVVRLGHPALRTAAREVRRDELAGGEVQQLIDDMMDTMRHHEGVGLAAPQVGEDLQLFIWEAGGEAGSVARVVINPMVSPHPGELVYDWEGCLSIPDLRGLVPRHPTLRLAGLDREGNPLEVRAEGFEARVIQHELDHLNGIVFLDRMRDLKSLTYVEERTRYLEQPRGASVVG